MFSEKYIVISLEVGPNGRSFNIPAPSPVDTSHESEVSQSFLTLGNPMDCNQPGSSSMGFSRQEYWSGLPFPSPGALP